MATIAKKAPIKDPPIFIWEGKNKAGVKVRGEEQAANVNMLRATLRRRGIQPKVIKEKAGMQDLIKKIRQDIEGGADLGTALGNHPKYFDDLFVSLVKAGEHSGSLEDMLEKIATYKEKSESMKRFGA